MALSNALSLLKPDGLLIVDVPNMECLGFKKYGQCWYHTDAGRHLQFFTQKSLAFLLEHVGAAPLKWEFEGFSVQYTPDWIAGMAVVWDSLFAGESVGCPPPRPSLANSMTYLPKAILAADPQKYATVRVYARPKAG
jgi:hypothetical protein